MTNERTCLRCDWHGSTDDSTCPNCSAALFELGRPPSEAAGVPVRRPSAERSREAAGTASVAPSSTPPRPSSRPAHHEAAEPTSTRSRSLVAVVLAVVVLAIAVGWWLNAHTAPTPRAPQRVAPVADLTGTLVYAVPDGPDRSRLWRWDLATGRVLRGPRVPRAIELVDAHGAAAGWIGVTSALPDGRLEASVLRFLAPDDRATPILRGDDVAWAPDGSSVAVVRRGSLRTGCRRSVSIVWARLVPALRDRKFADPALCGDLLSIGQDDAQTFFTLDRGGRVGVFVAGIGRIHPVVPGYAMMAINGVSDIIVIPEGALATRAPLPSRPEQEHADLLGAGLSFIGTSDLPLPYGVGDDRFAIARFLAWSRADDAALVVGRQGVRRGLYLLDTESGNGIVGPRYVGPVSGIPYATFTIDGSAIVQTAEGLFVTSRDGLVPLTPPADAPAPDGPIVWIV